jgi:hypothetical protein
MDEKTMVGLKRLGSSDRRAYETRSVNQSKRTQLELSPGRGQLWLACSHTEGKLELPCLRLQIDPQKGGSDDCAKQDHASVAENVTDRVRDGHVRNQ